MCVFISKFCLQLCYFSVLRICLLCANKNFLLTYLLTYSSKTVSRTNITLTEFRNSNCTRLLQALRLRAQTYIITQMLCVLFTSYQVMKPPLNLPRNMAEWRKLWLMHLYRSVDLSTLRIRRLIAKKPVLIGGKFNMFRIISPKLLELFHTRTISQLRISAVKWHFST